MLLRFVLVPMVAVVVGCASPVPVAQNFPLTYQRVAGAAHHWDVVAQDVVEQTVKALATTPQLQQRGIYVVPARSTAFNVAFREMMITHLVTGGTRVSECPVDRPAGPGFSFARDVDLKYDTQVIVHGDAPRDIQPGQFTVLASGVAVLREIALGGEATPAVIGGVAFAEWWSAYRASPTRTEIIVTTTVVEDNRFVLRRKDVYYVPDGDAGLFAQRVARRSACPNDASLADAGTREAESEYARRALIEREMRRVNPNWKSGAAYSY